MKPNSFTREILLVTTSSFSQRQFCEKDSHDESSHVAPAEQLEAACWNGLLNELLPEIMNDSSCDEKIYLWQVEMRGSYLRLSLGASNPDFETQFTIDPAISICEKEMN